MNQKHDQKKEESREQEVNGKFIKEAIDAINQQLESCRIQNRSKKRQYNRISIGRLLLFCGIVSGVLLGTAGKFWWGWLVAAGMLAAFVLIMQYHEKLRLEQQYLENRIRVECRQLARLQGGWNTFPDTGAEFLEEKDYVARDLDIFGKASLYQMICVAHTPWGRQRLAEVLKQGEPDLQCLRERQEAVQELLQNRELMERYESLALGVELETGKPGTQKEPLTAENTTATKNIDIRKTGTILRIIGIGYTGLFILGIVGAVLHWWPTGIIMVLFFAALGTSWLTSGISSRLIGDIFTQERQLHSYLQMMYTIKSAGFESRTLSELAGRIAGKGSAMEGLGKLEHILDAYNIRHNPIVHWGLSGICLYDYHLAARAADWRIRYEQKLQDGIRALGDAGQSGGNRYFATDLNAGDSAAGAGGTVSAECQSSVNSGRTGGPEQYYPERSDGNHHRFQYVWKDDFSKKYRYQSGACLRRSTGLCRGSEGNPDAAVYIHAGDRRCRTWHFYLLCRNSAD